MARGGFWNAISNIGRAFAGGSADEAAEFVERRLGDIVSGIERRGKNLSEIEVEKIKQRLERKVQETMEANRGAAWNLVTSRATTGAIIGGAWGGLNAYAEGGSFLRGAMGGVVTGGLIGGASGVYSAGGRYSTGQLQRDTETARRMARSSAGNHSIQSGRVNKSTKTAKDVVNSGNLQPQPDSQPSSQTNAVSQGTVSPAQVPIASGGGQVQSGGTSQPGGPAMSTSSAQTNTGGLGNAGNPTNQSSNVSQKSGLRQRIMSMLPGASGSHVSGSAMKTQHKPAHAARARRPNVAKQDIESADWEDATIPIRMPWWSRLPFVG